MAKVLGLKQMLQKKHKLLEHLPEDIKRSFGGLVEGFIMIIWGLSGQGKSNLVMEFIKCLMPYGKVLYVGLEEGFEASMQNMILRHLNLDEHNGSIEFADHNMKIADLKIKLKKRKSAKWIVIDSLQYWKISYAQYKELKEECPGKGFIFISHAKGKNPMSQVANDIRYDAGVKVRVHGFVAEPTSRYGGNKPYIIWKEGAMHCFGKKKVNRWERL